MINLIHPGAPEALLFECLLGLRAPRDLTLFRLTDPPISVIFSGNEIARVWGIMSKDSMSSVRMAFQVGTAACAMAGAAVFMPGAVASASPVASMPMAGLGSSLDQCDDVDADPCEGVLAVASAEGSANVAAGPFQNDFIWLGDIPDPAPENIAVFEYNIIPLFSPAIQAAAYAWWDSVIPNGINACILGATAKIDSYSTLTVGFTKGCSG